ncbi:DUF4405 domain-containing protein [Thermodesulfobacteriota bacterium]
MEENKKKGFKWRGLATFLLSLGMLVEIVSGVVLYITPLGRYANWNNWTLWGLTKGEWGAVHTIFGYLLLIIIGLHLYFNWKVVVHFFWSKVKNTFNLKKELAVSAVVTVFIFAGTLWGIPPFSTIMDLGMDAKHSWEAKSGVASFPGYGRAATSAHDTGNRITEQTGRGWGASTSGWNAEGSIAPNQPGGEYFTSGRGQGRGAASQVAPQVGQVSYTERGGGYGRKTVDMVCSENNVSSQAGLARLHDNGISANARDYVRDLATRSGKRPSEIIQIIREGRTTSTHTEEKVDTSGRGQGRGAASQVAPQVGQVSYAERGGGYGRKTVDMVCSENNVSSQAGLARLHDNGISANARDYVRDLATRSGKRPSEIIQIIREGRTTSTHTEEKVDLNAKTSETLRGRDYVSLGKPGTLSGVLVQVGDEWGLKADGITYEIHMGPSDFRSSKGFVLKDGAEAAVTGFIHGTDISVTVIETGGQALVLRDETGRPAWSGGPGFQQR